MDQSKKASLKLIVGLGNPGPTYAHTRHNAGAWFVEALCKAHRLNPKNEAKFQARISELNLLGETVLLALSNTYMNHSGQVVSSIAKYYQIPPQAILIAHDELDINPGAIRFKIDGGHGGHNGLRDVIHHLQSRDFNRLRIGIGHPRQQEHQAEVVDYVLHKPSLAEEKKIEQALQLGIQAFPWMVKGEFQKVMNFLHSAEGEANGV